MAKYVQLGAVRTWYDERGMGEPLVLLHPGMFDARAFDPSIGPLAGRFRVFTPERRAHGHTPDVEGPITYEFMAQDTIAFLEIVVGGPARLMGHSDGAIVALLTAIRRPDLVDRLVVVSGVFHLDGWAPETTKASSLTLDDAAAEFFATAYGEVSPDGRDHFPVVLNKMARLHEEGPTLTTSDLRRITTRTLVMVGDDDEVVLEHAIAMYRALSKAELAVVPGTSHGLLVEKPALCNQVILEFLTTAPVPTAAPIRRADGS